MLIQIIKPYFSHKDDRGNITGLINQGRWEEANLIKSEAGSVRGNHFHEDTDEVFIVLEGKIDVTVYHSSNPSDIETYKFFEGDIFWVPKNIVHTFIIVESAKWINLLSKKMDSNSQDIKYHTR